MKKILSLVLVMTMMLGATIPVFANTDEPSSWAKAEVTSAISNGYVPAHLQSNYQSPITREEFAELFVTAVFADYNNVVNTASAVTKTKSSKMGPIQNISTDLFLQQFTTDVTFSDTDNKLVKVANMLGMVNGVGDNKFNPNGLITREQAAIMFVNYMQTVDSPTLNNPEWLGDLDTASSWAKDAVAWAYGAGYILGTKNPVLNPDDAAVIEYGNFDTQGNLTREQAIIIVSRLGRDGKDLLQNIIIRGILKLGPYSINAGGKIEGDKVSMKSKSEYDYAYDGIVELFSTQTKLKDLHGKYTAGELRDAMYLVNGGSIQTAGLNHLTPVLDGETVTYTSNVFTLVYSNQSEYVFSVEKLAGTGYTRKSAILLTIDESGRPVSIQFTSSHLDYLD